MSGLAFDMPSSANRTTNLTYVEAMAAAKKGHRVREHEMSAGWTIAWLMGAKGGDYYCINPHTGSNYRYTPSGADKLSTRWSIAS